MEKKRFCVSAAYPNGYQDREVRDAAARAVVRAVIGTRRESRAHGSDYIVATNTRANTWEVADRETAERVAACLRVTLRGRVTVRGF